MSLLIMYNPKFIKMKHLFLSLFLMLTALCATAQETEFQRFSADIKKCGKKLDEAVDRKDYKQAEIISKDMISRFGKCSPEIQTEYRDVLGGMYYNLTCYLSLQNKKKLALEAFTKATDNDWYNYPHATKDSDLDNIRKEPRFIALMAEIREKGDYLYILQKSNDYQQSVSDQEKDMRFTYMTPNDSNLVRVREYFNLDSVAGSGDEISKIKNLLAWVHNEIRHDGSSDNPTFRNAIDIIELCRKENRGVNCRMMAQVLAECYLAMGFNARYVTCMPKVMIYDCHVINAVYSNTLDKWIWVDPTFNAYVMDEKGNLLGISEVRERLRTENPLVLNDDANWNGKRKKTKEDYLDQYMAKNLYYVTCRLSSEYNSETPYEGKVWSPIVALIPLDFESEQLKGSKLTSNVEYFWQSPYAK